KGPLLEVTSRIGRSANRMEAFGSAIVYLGPLRDDPRFAYPLGHTIASLPVGEKGEFTAAYLARNGSSRRRYRAPGADSTTNGDLLSAVSKWCEYLGIADEVTVQSLGKLGHRLGLKVGGSERDPTAIGVGASQLLPVVVLVLGATSRQFVLLEQPELHLHPKVQSRLADFLSSARPDLRLLIETHSEYLLTRLRLHVVNGKIEKDDLAVLF